MQTFYPEWMEIDVCIYDMDGVDIHTYKTTTENEKQYVDFFEEIVNAKFGPIENERVIFSVSITLKIYKTSVWFGFIPWGTDIFETYNYRIHYGEGTFHKMKVIMESLLHLV